ncbi:MAG: metal-dependent hydrolase, partial [Candidatus Melainabacteria bacterium HGW-Melainabacteria-1]
WILIGDFNATPDAPEIRQLLAASHPVFSTDPAWLQALSYPAIKPDRRIDYIFFSKAFELGKMEVLDNQGSTDHRPIYAELKLK